MGKGGASFGVVCWLACISREEDGWAGIKKGGESGMVIFNTIIVCVQLSVWTPRHYSKSNSTARWGNGQYLG